VVDRLGPLGLNAKAYLADGISEADKTHPYMKYLLMFEALFLNDEGSFVRMTQDSGIFVPILRPLDDEAGRVSFIRQVHHGVVDFVRDVGSVFENDILNYSLSGDQAISGYLSVLKHPTKTDVGLFDNVAFENVYSGRNSRFVVNPVENDPDSTIASSIWKEGAAIVAARMTASRKNRDQHLPFRLLTEIVRRTSNERQFHKFLRMPKQFFIDCKNPIIRQLNLFFR